jgi:hypothetical protein
MKTNTEKQIEMVVETCFENLMENAKNGNVYNWGKAFEVIDNIDFYENEARNLTLCEKIQVIQDNAIAYELRVHRTCGSELHNEIRNLANQAVWYAGKMKAYQILKEVQSIFESEDVDIETMTDEKRGYFDDFETIIEDTDSNITEYQVKNSKTGEVKMLFKIQCGSISVFGHRDY